MFEVNVSIAFPREPSYADALDLVEIIQTYTSSFTDAFFSVWVEDDDILESAVHDRVNMDLIHEMTRGE